MPRELGFDFTNISHTAFMLEDPIRLKKTDELTVFFALLGSACVKACHKMLVTLTLDVRRTQSKRQHIC